MGLSIGVRLYCCLRHIMTYRQIVQACFIAEISLGGLVFLCGIALPIAVSAAQLEVVLTPEQFADGKTRDFALAVMDKSNRRFWPEWCAIGAGIAIVGVVGLNASSKSHQPDVSQ